MGSRALTALCMLLLCGCHRRVCLRVWLVEEAKWILWQPRALTRACHGTGPLLRKLQPLQEGPSSCQRQQETR